MSRGIVPQYIKRTGPARHINKQTKIQTDIPVIQEILVEKIKNTGTEEGFKVICFHKEIPAAVGERISNEFNVPKPSHSECHIIEAKGDEIQVYALSERGLFYGAVSIIHLMEKGCVDELLAYDYPVCDERGMKVFLPASKDIGFFKKFVDMICYFKFNSIMIEIGGGMEYKRHPEINEGWIKYCEEMSEYSGKTTKIQDYTYPWYKNAIHMENGGGNFLTQDEVRELAAYCRSRMLEVIPEVPSLGHCDYLMMGHMDIAERPEDPYADTYCPSNPASYELLFDVLDEVIEVFNPEVINIGHDEYYTIGVCEKCRGKSGADIFAGDVNKIYNYLKSKGVKTLLWGDKLLKNAKVPNAGPFGGAEIQMYMPQFHQKDGKKIGIMPATYQAIDMVPKDLLILHWNWNLGENLEDEFLDKNFNIRYGNFEGYYFSNWKEHIKKSGRRGAFISNWSSLNEVILQRNTIFFGISYAYEMFWNHNYEDGDYETIRDKTFEYLYHYKYADAQGLEAKESHDGHPAYVELIHTTDYHVDFKFFVDGVFPEKEVYEIGQLVFEYEDGQTEKVPLTYGYNIGNKDVKWERTKDGDPGYNHGFKLSDHLLEMSFTTLPVKKGEETVYKCLVANPRPEKVLKEFRTEVYPDKNCKVHTESVRYLS